MSNVTAAAIRLGVVGGGLIAQVAHLPALRSLDRLFDVVALAEPDRGRDALARRYGISAAFESHSALLDRATLDAILVCSPNGTHARVVLDALDAGLHVLVEKPLCLDPADAHAIVAAATRSGKVVQVGYMKRFDPAFERLLDCVPALGELRLASSTTVDPGIGQRLRPAGYLDLGGPGRRLAEAQKRDTAAQVATALDNDDERHVTSFSDAFLGALVHDVNLALTAFGGEWEVVDAAKTEDGSWAYGSWEQERGARYNAAWVRLPAAGAFREDLALYGADGAARLRFAAPYLGTPAELRIDGTPDTRWVEPANTYVRQLEHFHACITRGQPCRTPAEEGVRDIELLTELYRMAVPA